MAEKESRICELKQEKLALEEKFKALKESQDNKKFEK